MTGWTTMHKWCLFPEIVTLELTLEQVNDRGLDPSFRWSINTVMWLWMSIEYEPRIINDQENHT
jgi:hypothetical protein